MTSKKTASETLDRDFHELRHRLLDIAAGFDRIGQCDGAPTEDPRLKKLIAGARVLCDGDDNRAERIQLMFSDPYDAQWRDA